MYQLTAPNATSRLTDDIVVQLRRIAKEGNDISYQEYGRKLNVTKNTIGRAIRGESYAHVNAIEPPFRKIVSRDKRKDQVIALYEQKVSQAQIAAQLKMSKTTVTILCKEIAEQRKAELQAKRDKAKELYLTGELTNAEIGRMLGVHRDIVLKWCRGLKNKRVKAPKIVRPRAPKERFGDGIYSDYRIYYFGLKAAPRVRLIHKTTGETISMMMQKYLMSVHVGRRLEEDEMVIFKEGNTLSIDNLILLTKEQYREHIGLLSSVQCKCCSAVFKPRNRTNVVCSQECRAILVSRRQRGSRKPRQLYTCRCEICEQSFTSHNRSDDLCRSKACRDIVADLG